ncbi:hypothetical protein NDGK_00579 [Clostridiales bacterium CHKCI001]|nr:hypothetical protein NDGK_00579 [Clostridiales bacterium CHKCI001]
MSNQLCFLKLHIKSQWLFYLFPVAFLYCFILIYHAQLFEAGIKEETIRKVFDSAQKMLLLLSIWYQYMGFRIVLSSELKEFSYGIQMKWKLCWWICCTVVLFILIIPYLFWLMFQVGGDKKTIISFGFQCFVIQILTLFLMHFCKSALAGLGFAIAYYFLNVNGLLPEYLSIARIGVLPRDYSITWYIVQTISAILLFVLIILQDKLKL